MSEAQSEDAMTLTTTETTCVAPAAPTVERKGLPAIFISYRRVDTRFYVDILAKALRERFGDYQVFVDTREGEEHLGTPYPDRIRQALDACDVLLVVIGKSWLVGLDKPDDWVRIEVSSTLVRPGLRVVPVLVDGAPKPDSGKLPSGMQQLEKRFWIEIPDASWDLGVRILIRNIEEVVKHRDAGLVGAVSLALPAATLAALPLVAYRWIAPLYAPELRTAVLLAISAGLVVGVGGWHGTSGSSRWLAAISRGCRRWRWVAVLLTVLLVSGIGYHMLRPVKVTVRTLEKDELSTPCLETYVVQNYRVADERQSPVPRTKGSRACDTEFAGNFQQVAIRTGLWPRFEDAEFKVSVRHGLLAALLVPRPWPKRLKQSAENGVLDETTNEVAFDVALEDAGNLVCWFEIAAKQEACARISLTLGGKLIGSDITCSPIQ